MVKGLTPRTGSMNSFFIFPYFPNMSKGYEPPEVRNPNASFVAGLRSSAELGSQFSSRFSSNEETLLRSN